MRAHMYARTYMCVCPCACECMRACQLGCAAGLGRAGRGLRSSCVASFSTFCTSSANCSLPPQTETMLPSPFAARTRIAPKNAGGELAQPSRCRWQCARRTSILLLPHSWPGRASPAGGFFPRSLERCLSPHLSRDRHVSQPHPMHSSSRHWIVKSVMLRHWCRTKLDFERTRAGRASAGPRGTQWLVRAVRCRAARPV